MRYASSINNPLITIGYATHPGRTGKNNEDDYVVFESQFVEGPATAPQPIAIAMVADGIGGNIAGEMASHLAAENFHRTYKEALNRPPRIRLVEGIEASNLAIYNRAISDTNLQGMGTTIVAAAIMGSDLYVAHAGDSRAYLIRNGYAHQLTIDHTWAQEAIEAGRLTPEQAKEHPNRHVIKRFLGIAPEVEVDTILVDYKGLPVNQDKVHEAEKKDVLGLQSGDTILLCSDGLTDVVSDKQIEQTLKKYNLQDAANQLIELANKAGGPDNITVVLMQHRDPNTPMALPASGGRRSIAGPLLAVVILLLVVAIGAYALGWIGNRGNSAPLEAQVTMPPTATAAVAALPSASAVTVAQSSSETPEATATTTPTEAPSPSATLPPPTSIEVAQEPTSTPVPAIAEAQPSATISPSEATAIADATRMVNLLESNALTVSTTLTMALTIAAPMVPTPEAAPANGISATSTPVPDNTNTPAPTATPTATATAPTNTPTPLAGGTPAKTGTVQPPATSAPTSGTGGGANTAAIAVQLAEPTDNDTVQGRRTFKWQFAGTLPEGLAFEPVFWKAGQNPLTEGRGLGGSTRVNELSIDLTKFPGTSGTIKWGVRLWNMNNNTPVRMVSEERIILVQLSGSGGSSGGGGDNPPPSSTTTSGSSGGNND